MRVLLKVACVLSVLLIGSALTDEIRENEIATAELYNEATENEFAMLSLGDDDDDDDDMDIYDTDDDNLDDEYEDDEAEDELFEEYYEEEGEFMEDEGIKDVILMKLKKKGAPYRNQIKKDMKNLKLTKKLKEYHNIECDLADIIGALRKIVKKKGTIKNRQTVNYLKQILQHFGKFGKTLDEIMIIDKNQGSLKAAQYIGNHLKKIEEADNFEDLSLQYLDDQEKENNLLIERYSNTSMLAEVEFFKKIGRFIKKGISSVKKVVKKVVKPVISVAKKVGGAILNAFPFLERVAAVLGPVLTKLVKLGREIVTSNKVVGKLIRAGFKIISSHPKVGFILRVLKMGTQIIKTLVKVGKSVSRKVKPLVRVRECKYVLKRV
mmetsp:Transcript_2430/g.3495  ORF Transcript_2430/g.3495 Transcript_2430/m.3495 type:complete len:379 (-) Transcript_2430:45-1181(-)